MNEIIKIKPLAMRSILPSILNSFFVFSFVLLLYFIGFISVLEELKAAGSKVGINLEIILGVILLFFFLLTVIRIITRFLRIRNTLYTISSKSIEFDQKFISVNKTSIPTSQITNIDSYVSFFWDKIFKTGTLKAYTSGSSSVDLVLSDIKNIDGIYNEIQQFTKTSNSEYTNYSSAEKKTKKSSQLLLNVKPNAKIAVILTSLSLIPFGFFFALPIIMSMLPLLLFGQEGTIITISSLLGMFALAGLIFLGVPLYNYKYYSNISYNFYEDNVEYFDGFFNIQKHTIPYKRITNSDSFQSILDRILNVHTITIETAGSVQSQIKIKFVNNGEEINERILEILQQKGDN